MKKIYKILVLALSIGAIIGLFFAVKHISGASRFFDSEIGHITAFFASCIAVFALEIIALRMIDRTPPSIKSCSGCVYRDTPIYIVPCNDCIHVGRNSKTDFFEKI